MKKLLSVIAAILFAATSFAQVDEVTLTTIGTGRNEDEATLRALRSALEQSFGTFVSENTTIINDELVRDEIASTSKGNVKSYKKLSVVQLPNRTTSVTLQATVSINKLISYARNNGSRAEFAGQTYAMNVKLLKLQQQNANKTLEVMKNNVIALCHGVFDYELKLGDLRKENLKYYSQDELRKPNSSSGYYSIKEKYTTNSVYTLPFSLDVYSTDVTTNIRSLILETIDAIRMSPSMVKDFDRNSLTHYGNLPVSESKMDEIYDDIIVAIMNDFWKVRIKKINDSEYFTFSKFNEKSIIVTDDSYIQDFWPYGMMWLYSSNSIKTNPISIVKEGAGTNYIPRNAIRYGVLNTRMRNHPDIPGLISQSILSNIGNALSKWNTNVDGQIHQQKLCSFDLCIVLTDAELERFNGLELDRVTSPKYTSAPKPDKKKDAVKGYKKMCDLPLNSPVKIKGIRILTDNLPRKTFTISMTSKGSNGQQTYKMHVGAKRVEGQFWEFNGDPIASAFPNAINAHETKDYIDMQIVMGEYTIKKFPKELSDFVYVK